MHNMSDCPSCRRIGGTLESVYGPRPHWKIVCTNTKTNEVFTIPRYSCPTKELLLEKMKNSPMTKRFDKFDITPADSHEP